MSKQYPILEFDPSREAIIEPTGIIEPIDAPEHCVFCFFLEVIEKVVRERSAKVIWEGRWEDGVHRLYETEHENQRLAFMHCGVGAPVSAGLLEEVHAAGCSKFIACGGAGVLDKADRVGKLFVPERAVRDEGLSYHYLPPSRLVEADPDVVKTIGESLRAKEVSFELCTTWTTDAPFRETVSMTERRRAEGCRTVEMEAAAFFAVAQFRGIPFGQILYAGDAVVAEGWDERTWTDRGEIRENLFWLAADACLKL
ncbi:MAG: nucleoside phosphorylase [bacterium]